MNKREFLALTAFGLPMLRAGLASAAAWPSKPITLLIGMAPGGTTDLICRALIPHMEKDLGTTIVPKNVPGAGANLAVAQMAATPADGYTLSSFGITNFVAPYTTDVTFDPWSLVPIGAAGEIYYGIGVGKNSPLKTIADLVEAGRSRTVTYASSAVAGTRAMAQLATLTGAKLKWIPAQDGAEAVLQAAGGHVDAVIQAPGEMTPAIDGGDLRLIASAVAERWPSQPEVATLKEQGFEASSLSYIGVAAPAGLPADIQKKLSTAFADACARPDIQELIARYGLHPRTISPTEMTDLAKATVPDLIAALDAAGMLKRRP